METLFSENVFSHEVIDSTVKFSILFLFVNG